ncbi:MAG: miaB 2 [Firmicutes bacterium]|nr:miaB 2 [Bacillota bacterium]
MIAATKVKIKGYITVKDGFQEAVADMMALFEIPEMETLDDSLPSLAICIRNQVEGSQLPSIHTVLEYVDENQERQEYERHSLPAEPEELTTTAIRRLLRLNIFQLLHHLTGYTPGPWGIMRGVRPAKLVHRLLDEGMDTSGIISHLHEHYAVSHEKATLITDIALRQRNFLLEAKDKQRVSVYIGIPYCLSKCYYCSFSSALLPSVHSEIDKFLQALEKDINSAADTITKCGLDVDSLYIGGGTPTSLPEQDFAALLSLVKKKLATTHTREFTVEAGRPDSTNETKILAMCQAGVTRVSVNPQSMQEKTLKRIGRNHNVRDIISMFQKIRDIGIPVINMDIIVGLPGETITDLEDTLKQISVLCPDNLTVHTLALKRGSLLMENHEGLSQDQKLLASKMLVTAERYASQMGMVPYYLYRQKNMAGNLENVGYALPGKECLYNIQIIDERQTIIGIGPASATKAIVPGKHKLSSFYNPKDIRTYIDHLPTHLQRREALIAKWFNN